MPILIWMNRFQTISQIVIWNEREKKITLIVRINKKKMVMSMSFHWAYTETVLFSWWKIESVFEYLFTCFLIGLTAFLLEFLIGFRHRLEVRKRKQRRRQRDLTTASKNTIEKVLSAIDGTCLHLLSLLLAYPLMLIIMTYNYGFLFFVLLGSGMGYFFFSGMRTFGENGDTADSDDNPLRESGCH